MLQFLPGYAWFAIAGAIAATGPVIIHLLNRRRFRVVRWGAMDFLREAIRRNRRILELRDLLLLILRTLAVLLFGLALARPFVPADSVVGWRIALPAGALALACGLAAATLSSAPALRRSLAIGAVALAAIAIYFSGESLWSSGSNSLAAAADPTQPVHAVMLIDNSLSMSYTLERSLLDEAKARAMRLIDRLPEGSHIAVLPVCGPYDRFTLDPYPNKDDARAAVERITVVDRQSTGASALALARDACAQAPEFPAAAKRVVFIGDQQEVNWPEGVLASHIGGLPEFQVVDVSATDASNAWVESVELEDGIADTQSPTKIIARVRCEGREPRENVQVSLWVDDDEVASQTIDRLEPDSARELTFHHQFDVALSPGETRQVPVRVTLPPDRLTMDDTRCLAATVVAALPVVFVDELGSEGEQSQRQVFGETRPLRRILAPSDTASESAPPLVSIRHTTIDRIDRKLLTDARLVVIAGIEQPGEAAVKLLRDYVSQGGQIVIAAGARFSAERWNDQAWQNGDGILPAPLDGLFGESLEDNPAKLNPIHIAYDSLAGQDEFHIAGESEDSQAAFYRDPLFFKIVRVDASSKAIEAFVDREKQRLSETRTPDASNNQASDDTKTSSPSESATRWLAWRMEPIASATTTANTDPTAAAVAAAPRVLARFTNGSPFLIERQIGQGDVLFIATSLRSGWNTWPSSYTMFLADRLMRRRIERTIAVRNVSTDRDVAISVDANDVGQTFDITRPDGSTSPQEVEALSADSYGVTIGSLATRGFYRVAHQDSAPPTNSAQHDASDATNAANNQLVDSPSRTPSTIIAVNGPADESRLATVDRERLAGEAVGVGSFRWISSAELVSIEGAAVRGQNLWWWLVATVAACLVIEMTTLAWPMMRASAVSPAASTPTKFQI
jgi:hypothetical protein